MSIKLENGSFRSSRLGEIDLRALYAALVISNLLNLNTDELQKNCTDYILQC